MSVMAELKRSDFSKICRTCLLQKDNMEPIYKSDIPKMLLSFTNIKAFDQYPQNICIDCICEFGQFFTFQQQCIKNFNILENIVKNFQNKQIETAESLQTEAIDIIVQEEQTINDSHDDDENVADIDEYNTENDNDVRNSNISPETIEIEKVEKQLTDNKTPKKKKLKPQAKKLIDKKYSCKECSRTFITERNYSVHIMNHKQCAECGSYFPTQQKLEGHIRHKHRGEKLYTRVCTLCGRQFFSNTAFDYHMRSHTGENPYECDICHKKFKIISHLNSHRQYHSGIRRHACQICNKSFFTNVCLKKHVRSIHTGERPFACNICNKSFLERTNLKLHMKKVHEYA